MELQGITWFGISKELNKTLDYIFYSTNRNKFKIDGVRKDG